MGTVVYLGNLIPVLQAVLKCADSPVWIVEEEDRNSEIENFAKVNRLARHFVRSEADLRKVLNSLKPVRLGVIANFGIILSREALESAEKGFVNLHLGLLPEYPGRTPVLDALAKGEKVIGATLHRATEDVDRGPVISKKTIPAGASREDAQRRVAGLGPSMVEEYLKCLN